MGSFQGYDFEKNIALHELPLHRDVPASGIYTLVDCKEVADRYRHNSEYEFTIEFERKISGSMFFHATSVTETEYANRMKEHAKIIENVLLNNYGICSKCNVYIKNTDTHFQTTFNVYYL
jgi:hypothetical protein